MVSGWLGVPNPRHPFTNRNDMPLDQAVGYATHVVITCRPPTGAGSTPCGRHVIWPTADLYRMLPRCRTYADFRERLYCSRCKRRGWLDIAPAPR